MKNIVINVLTLCCGRHDLYERSLAGFVENVVKTNPDYKFRFFVHDDSANISLNNKIKNILETYTGEMESSFLASESNVGQTMSMYRLIKHANLSSEDFIFQFEEDHMMIEPISIDKMIELWNHVEKNYNVPVKQVILRTDDFTENEISIPGLTASRKNIVDYNDDFFILGTNQHKEICKWYGGSAINDDICCHPHLSKGEVYNRLKEEDVVPKSSAEDAIGLKNLESVRIWIRNQIYADHIGDYRYYSVYEGAKVRGATSTKISRRVEMREIKD